LRSEPEAGSWRLVLDGTRCDGYGMCALRCPELVTLDRRGYAGVERGAITSRLTLRHARRAVAGCPRGALSLTRRESSHAGRSNLVEEKEVR
jgi:ferredoxin